MKNPIAAVLIFAFFLANGFFIAAAAGIRWGTDAAGWAAALTVIIGIVAGLAFTGNLEE